MTTRVVEGVAVAPQESAPESPRCIWAEDRDHFVICTTRRALRRAVEQTASVASQVREPRARALAIRRKEAAIKDLLAHRCDVLGAPKVWPAERPTSPEEFTRAKGASGINHPRASAGPLTEIMADVAVLVALGKRAGAPDIRAEYDAAYHALEAKIERALPKPFTERLEGR